MERHDDRVKLKTCRHRAVGSTPAESKMSSISSLGKSENPDIMDAENVVSPSLVVGGQRWQRWRNPNTLHVTDASTRLSEELGRRLDFNPTFFRKSSFSPCMSTETKQSIIKLGTVVKLV